MNAIAALFRGLLRFAAIGVLVVIAIVGIFVAWWLVILAVLALYLFGGEVLRGFAFTMMIGVVTGTYSTVFIAAAIAIILSRREIGPSAGATAKTRTARA